MSSNQRQRAQDSPDQPIGCLPAILRTFWMAIGNLGLFFCGMFAARQPAPSALDFVYVGIVITLIVVRYLDITRFQGQTADGDPATIAHWRRYVIGLIPTAAALWVFTRFARAQGWM